MRRTKPVEDRFWAKVEKTDTCWNWTAARESGGYGVFRILGVLLQAHRWSYQQSNGEIPSGLAIDHTCYNRACVNPDHLRLATNKQNAENFSGLDSNNTSGVRGVSWNKQCRKWQAYVKHNGKRYHVGLFADIKDAEAAVKAKRNELFTHNDLDRVA